MARLKFAAAVEVGRATGRERSDVADDVVEDVRRPSLCGVRVIRPGLAAAFDKPGTRLVSVARDRSTSIVAFLSDGPPRAVVDLGRDRAGDCPTEAETSLDAGGFVERQYDRRRSPGSVPAGFFRSMLIGAPTTGLALRRSPVLSSARLMLPSRETLLADQLFEPRPRSWHSLPTLDVVLAACPCTELEPHVNVPSICPLADSAFSRKARVAFEGIARQQFRLERRSRRDPSGDHGRRRLRVGARDTETALANASCRPGRASIAPRDRELDVSPVTTPVPTRPRNGGTPSMKDERHVRDRVVHAQMTVGHRPSAPSSWRGRPDRGS